MSQLNVLVVEDDLTYRSALGRFLKGRYNVTLASSIKQAAAYLKHDTFDFGLVDLHLPDGSGFDLMKYARKLHPDMLVIVITADNTVENAVRAIHKGAFHYLMKPFPMERLDQLIQEAEKQIMNQASQKSKTLDSRLVKEKYRFDGIIGESPAMMGVFNLVEKVSNTDSTILIRGESGTGKELIARAIHDNSDRADKPFMPVNCGALQEELLESELFGHVRGAFTGAVQGRKGRFELADQGTIFLDEVGDMSPRLQVKLLRVLQEQYFEPVGTSESVQVSVRIIAATHRDLEGAVHAGTFREDLYYRLNVIPVFMPPLRDRADDVERLIYFFLDKYNKNKARLVTGISAEAMRALTSYRWPGNVRELENLLERLVVIKGEGHLTAADVPEKYFSDVINSTQLPVKLPEEGLDLNEVVGDLERRLINQALQRTDGNKNKAARLLKLKRTTLVEKLRRRSKKKPLRSEK